MSLRARQNGGGKIRNAGGRGGGNGSPGGRGNNSAAPPQPWDTSFAGPAVSFSNLNFTASLTTSGATPQAVGGAAKNTGKLYFELDVSLVQGSQFYFGVCSNTANPNGGALTGTTFALRRQATTGWSTGVTSPVAGPSTIAQGSIVGFAVDLNAKTLECYDDGVLSGSCSLAALSFTGGIRPCLYNNTTLACTSTIRTTLAEFTQSVPSGYLPWAEGS